MKKEITQKETRFKHQFNKNYVPDAGEINELASETVPDMSLTINQLLLNHTRGIQSDVKNYKGEYFETEIPKFNDITEMMEFKQELKKRHSELEDEIKASLKQKEDKTVSPITDPPKVSENDAV